MAHKKAAGSVKNLKDSQPKYRGVKVFWGQPVVAGNIIIRQKGSKYECGKNTYEAADFSILAETNWIVTFKKKNFKKFNGRTYLKTVVEVVPAEENKAPKKEAAPKKAAVKKETVKEAAPKKAAPAKKAPAKKPAAAKKAPAKKAEKAE
jgi:large subunit ribosomal protein L27